MYGMGYNMMGGMGGMGMGGMGASTTPMLSSVMSASACLSVVAGAGYLLMQNKQTPTEPPTNESDSVVTSAPSSTTATSPSDLDGIRLITIGDQSMRVDGKCSDGTVVFRQSKDMKWEWQVKKVGATSDGLSYYTLESYGKLFGAACHKRFLTSPVGCKGPPYLAGAQSGPQQFWVITGSDSAGYQIQSLACRQSRRPSYLLQSGQSDKRPQLSLRSGTSFQITTPYAA